MQSLFTATRESIGNMKAQTHCWGSEVMTDKQGQSIVLHKRGGVLFMPTVSPVSKWQAFKEFSPPTEGRLVQLDDIVLSVGGGSCNWLVCPWALGGSFASFCVRVLPLGGAGHGCSCCRTQRRPLLFIGVNNHEVIIVITTCGSWWRSQMKEKQLICLHESVQHRQTTDCNWFNSRTNN